jgi:hypothetical protein
VVEAGGVTTDAPIADSDGGFDAQPANAVDQVVASGVVTWSGTTPSAVFRTRTAFGQPTPAGTGTGSVDAPGPDPGVPVVPEPDRATGPSNPGAPSRPAPLRPAPARRQAACPRLWLTHTAGRPRLPLLGVTPAAISKCLGSPSRRARSRLEYGPGLLIEIRHGRAQSISLRDPSFRTDTGDFGVGSTLAALRRVLGTMTRDREGYRAVTLQGRGGAADVHVTVARGRVTGITAVLRRVSALDPTGRMLAERAR